ncbi:MAG: hypothetical protein GY749_32175, partial [Desulfobacteraceae bacterium]|nr:hypothetical protein [Desulfobacteraceae bacterium]
GGISLNLMAAMLRVGMQAASHRADVIRVPVVLHSFDFLTDSRRPGDIRAKRCSLHSHAKHGNEFFYIKPAG